MQFSKLLLRIKKINMKKRLLIITIASGMLIIASCGGPENRAKKIGKEYCECLNNVNQEMDILNMQFAIDSCYKLIEEDYKNALEKYKQDAEDESIFNMFYHATVDSTFNKTMKTFETAIKNQLEKYIWVRQNEEDYKNYIYSFRNDTMAFVNRKGNYIFSLKGNKINFTEHGDKSKGIIKFVKEDEFYLSPSDSAKEKAIYKSANLRDSLIGAWGSSGYDYNYNYYWDDYYYSKVSYSITIKPNGELWDASTKYTFEVIKDTIKVYYSSGKLFDKYSKDKMYFKNIKQFVNKKWAATNNYRYKSKEQKDLEFLFLAPTKNNK